jgi:tryptophan synthase alpha chain
LADGPTIQESSTMALHNGMTSQLLFDQLSTIREKRKTPIIMGYFNPMLQYGIEAFVKNAKETGIDGLIYS